MATKPSIESDAILLPNVIARNVVDELSAYLTVNEIAIPYDEVKLTEFLVTRAEGCYAADARYKRRWKRNPTAGREWLYTFMRHWLAGELYDRWPDTYRMIPRRLANGEPL